MREYPIASIIFLILTIITLIFAIILTQELISQANKVENKFVNSEFKYYQKKQEVVNVFRNIVQTFEDCLSETNCVCELYKLKMPTGYTIKINSDDGIKLTLIDKYHNQVLSEKILKLETGILTELKKCSKDTLYLKQDKKEWYLQREDDLEQLFFFPNMTELYKPSYNEACFLVKTINLKDKNLANVIKKYPRCSYKRKKKEELALNTFKSFVDRFKECIQNNNNDCTCNFPRLSLPYEYYIKIENHDGMTWFKLIKIKSWYEPEKVLLSLNLKSDLFIEKQGLSKFIKLNKACLINKGKGIKLYKDCDINSVSTKSSIINILMFDNKTKQGIFVYNNGLIRFNKNNDTVIKNKADIDYCITSKKNVYTNIWPVDKLNNVYYLSECFNQDNNCTKYIKIMQKQGSYVYATDHGFIVKVNKNEVIIKHKNGLKTFYKNIKPLRNIKPHQPIVKGQKIGELVGDYLEFAASDTRINTKEYNPELLCSANNVHAVLIEDSPNKFVNPVCYFNQPIMNRIVASAKCDQLYKGCDYYGNEPVKKDPIRLKILAMPVNWERDWSYKEFVNTSLDLFLKASPLNKCQSKLKIMYVDGKSNFGRSWVNGSCHIPNKNNCYSNGLTNLKECADEFQSRTGEAYDIVIGVDDSNIAHAPKCDYSERGWTSSNYNAVLVEAQHESDVAHELGHQFGLKDQYCDCQNAELKDLCGYNAYPNPLKDSLGCGNDCCFENSKSYPYHESCRWCKGNLDMNAHDTDNDKILDSGRRTLMSNNIYSSSYSIDEYLYLKAQPRLQCS